MSNDNIEDILKHYYFEEKNPVDFADPYLLFRMLKTVQNIQFV